MLGFLCQSLPWQGQKNESRTRMMDGVVSDVPLAAQAAI